MQKLFDDEGWVLIYTPPGMPQWQPIESVWTIAKGHVRKKYTHCDQNYTKMRKDLVAGFYGDKDTSYRGVTPVAAKKLTLKCEKLMLKWLNKHNDSNYTKLKEFKRVSLDMAEAFQFDNTFEVGEASGFAMLDDISSDEEEKE